MEGSTAETPADFTILARPNCSLSPASRALSLCFLILVTFGIALVFASFGAWMILPFAGLEVGVLVWAFHQLTRHADDYEKITLCGDRILIERKCAEQVSRHEFNRHWATLIQESNAAGEFCLSLRSHGQAVALGKQINREQRLTLAQELQHQLNK